MEDLIARFFDNIGLKLSGPLKFRFILQPLMSLYFAIRAGMRDSKTGQAPYFWGLIFTKGERKNLVKEGWTDVGKVFIVALIMDVIFQLIVLKTVYPVETILTAFMLAIVPYIIFRGLVNRIISLFRKKEKS